MMIAKRVDERLQHAQMFSVVRHRSGPRPQTINDVIHRNAATQRIGHVLLHGSLHRKQIRHRSGGRTCGGLFLLQLGRIACTSGQRQRQTSQAAFQ